MSSTILIIALYVVSIFLLDRVFRKTNVLTEQTLLRSSPIDALRGLLATAVVCHHFVVTYYWKVEGSWVRPQSDVLNNMGVVPVSLFFMITGYLFFGKVYKKNPEWGVMLRSRLQRIMPLYIFVVSVVFVISLMETGFVVEVSGIVKELVRWALFSGVSFNGFADSFLMTARVPWTLRYEWLFYLSLPIVAAVFNWRSYGKYFVLSLFIMVLALPSVYFGFIVPKLALLFFIGFVPVIIKVHFPRILSVMKCRFSSAVALIFLIVGMFIGQGYSIVQMLVVGVPFAIIALGNDVFGILKSNGLKALGEVSYSIYLTHGLVLYLLFSVFDVFSFGSGDSFHYNILLPVVLALVSASSVITFTVIEKPFIFAGSKKIPALT
ncbi:acyltransferase [Pseudomonas jessenii]|jgi:peptidoglycan/LPS O-acetylase OafA/YrhL|uniref:Acyltransferase n=1 Tax=Pseudomonas jessenii TaxID=77298 RepID=A0A2W0EXL6_PSEJE|nr:acyltransferase [Pseudomonas jessenii]PYY72557.1 acyltransferase [Pseudomonas jessenii]